MDFFEAQARAHRRTHRLVALFILAVAGTVAVGYFATILIDGAITGIDSGRRPQADVTMEEQPATPPLALWQPGVLGLVALATVAVVGGASAYKWSVLSRGGSAVADIMGGRRLNPTSTDPAERRLLDVVEEMAIAAGLPVPAVYVIDGEQAINAFAAGLRSSDAIVTVTRGALDRLSRDELQGVIGHEFSHILNGDMRLNIKLAAVIFGILIIALTGRAILWGFARGRVRSTGKGSGGAILLIIAVSLALLVVGYVGYFFGRLIQAAVSRQREFLADASSVQFTRNPAGITGALRKIGGLTAGSTLETHRAAEISHFFFAQAVSAWKGSPFATHPPLAARIRAVDPSWDGTFFDRATAGVQPAGGPGIATGTPAAAGPRGAAPRHPQAAMNAIGTLTAAAIVSAQEVRDGLPPRALAAARSPVEAPALVFAMLVSPDPAVRRAQLDVAGTAAGAVMDELAPALGAIGGGRKLALAHLAVPALRHLEPAALSGFLATLDRLVAADGRVQPFEYALQKMLRRSLAPAAQPANAAPPLLAAAAGDVAVILSALARSAAGDEAGALAAFSAGAARLGPGTAGLSLLAPSACGTGQLDSALDRLADAALPAKRNLLDAASHVVGSDGVIHEDEEDLIRAVSAALDVPMPPLPLPA